MKAKAGGRSDDTTPGTRTAKPMKRKLCRMRRGSGAVGSRILPSDVDRAAAADYTRTRFPDSSATSTGTRNARKPAPGIGLRRALWRRLEPPFAGPPIRSSGRESHPCRNCTRKFGDSCIAGVASLLPNSPVIRKEPVLASRRREHHRPAAADCPRTASAAVRMTSRTRSGWESIGTWLLSSSMVVARIRLAIARSRSG
jgi:hypothetical protein